MKKLIFTLIITLFCFKSYTQSLLDSAYFYIDLKEFDTSLNYAMRYLKRADLSQDQKGEAYFTIGYNYEKKRMPLDAMNFYSLASRNYENTFCKGLSHKNMGLLFKKFGLYNEAIEQLSKALDYNTNEIKESKYLISRAISYKNVAKYDSAFKDVYEAERIATKMKDKSMLFECYNQMGLIKKDAGDYEEAIAYFKSANLLNTDNKAYINLGKTYQLSGNMKKAQSSYEKALGSKLSIKQKFKVNQNLGELNFEMGEVSKAISYFNLGIELFEELSYKEVDDIEIHRSLANCYKLLKNSEETIFFLEINSDLHLEFNRYQNKLLDKYRKQLLSDAEKSVIFQIKEQKKKEKTIYLASGLVGLSFCISILFFSRYIRNKKESKSIKKELDNAIGDLTNI